jgi:hypothetical protein
MSIIIFHFSSVWTLQHTDSHLNLNANHEPQLNTKTQVFQQEKTTINSTAHFKNSKQGLQHPSGGQITSDLYQCEESLGECCGLLGDPDPNHFLQLRTRPRLYYEWRVYYEVCFHFLWYVLQRLDHQTFHFTLAVVFSEGFQWKSVIM